MDKKAKIATITALVLAIAVLALLVYAAPKKCNNGVDDDNDGLVDYPNDPGCSSASDNTETSSSLVCDNGVDETNDADTLADYRLSGGDPGCASVTDTSEIDGQCDDLADNDRDGFVDYPNDPECTSFASKESNCQDSDGGFVVGSQGIISGSSGGVPYSNTDFCLDTVKLREFWCSGGTGGIPTSTDYNCPVNNATGTGGCLNGACV